LLRLDPCHRILTSDVWEFELIDAHGRIFFCLVFRWIEQRDHVFLTANLTGGKRLGAFADGAAFGACHRMLRDFGIALAGSIGAKCVTKLGDGFFRYAHSLSELSKNLLALPLERIGQSIILFGPRRFDRFGRCFVGLIDTMLMERSKGLPRFG